VQLARLMAGGWILAPICKADRPGDIVMDRLQVRLLTVMSPMAEKTTCPPDEGVRWRADGVWHLVSQASIVCAVRLTSYTFPSPFLRPVAVGSVQQTAAKHAAGVDVTLISIRCCSAKPARIASARLVAPDQSGGLAKPPLGWRYV
jgi:hypothetical protein